MSVTIRPATPADGETLLSLINGLAEYEKLTPPDAAGRVRLLADLAGGSRFDALLAEADGEGVGYAIFFPMYSTFAGRPKVYIEDIFVKPEARSTGAGFALFRAIAAEALVRDCLGLEWEVLDWNRLAIDFYERLGGEHDTRWLRYALGEDAMRRLAGDQSSRS
jgi:GNAT superfamily N-acetyltransferase